MAFDSEDLKRRACQETALAEFGKAPFQQSLELLCRSLEKEARLTPEGKVKAENLLVGHLAERLRLEDFVVQHPRVQEQALAPTIFLIGMPRSGTTALSQYLSEDPALRSIPRWESKRLTPPESGAHGQNDPRIAEIRAEFTEAHKQMPWRQKILPNSYEDPAEHGVLMALTFLNLQWPTLFRIPGWNQWVMQQDMKPAYSYLARVLKVLQWAKPAQRWNLKLPPDLFALDAISTTFPDAQFVWLHRQPIKAISSVCSLCAQVREQQGGAKVVPEEIGPEQLEFQALAVDRGMAARARIGEDRFTDVWQEDLGRNPLGTIATLYKQLGLKMTGGFRENLEARLQDKPRGRFGKHQHDLGSYGLDEATVNARFARYIERFHPA